MHETTGSDKFGANANLVHYLSTLNSDQIQTMNAQYKQFYGQSFYQAINKTYGDSLSLTTKGAIENGLLKGSDKRTAQDDENLAWVAARTGGEDGLGLLHDAIGANGTAASDQARAELQGDKSFHNLINRQWCNSENAAVAQDYLKNGQISLATIAKGDKKDPNDLTVAIANATPQEREQFAQGQRLSESGKEAVTAQEKQALQYFEQMHSAFNEAAKGNKAQVARWQNQLNGNPTFADSVAGDDSARNIVNSALGMNAQDREQYRHDAAYRQQVDSIVNQDLQGSNKIVARALLAQIGKNGEAPKATAVDKVVLDSLNGVKGEQAIKTLQAALTENPELAKRASASSDACTVANSANALQDAITQSAVNNLGGDAQKFLSSGGKLTLTQELAHGFDKSEIYSKLASTSPSEQQQVLGQLSPAEKQIAENSIRQNGRLTLADQVRSTIVDGGNVAQYAHQLEKLTGAEKEQLFNEYTQKYGGSFAADFMKKVPDGEQQNFEDLLSTTTVDPTHDYAMALAQGAHDGQVEDASNLTADRATDQYQEALTHANALFASMSPAHVQQLNEAVAQAQLDYKAAREKYDADHPGFWQKAEDIGLSVGVVAASIAAGAAGGVLVGGLTYAVLNGLATEAEGGHYDWSIGNLAKQTAIGALYAGSGGVIGAIGDAAKVGLTALGRGVGIVADATEGASAAARAGADIADATATGARTSEAVADIARGSAEVAADDAGRTAERSLLSRGAKFLGKEAATATLGGVGSTGINEASSLISGEKAPSLESSFVQGAIMTAGFDLGGKLMRVAADSVSGWLGEGAKSEEAAASRSETIGDSESEGGSLPADRFTPAMRVSDAGFPYPEEDWDLNKDIAENRRTIEIAGRTYNLDRYPGQAFYYDRIQSQLEEGSILKVHVQTENPQDFARLLQILIPALGDDSKLAKLIGGYKTIDPAWTTDDVKPYNEEFRLGSAGQGEKGFTIYPKNAEDAQAIAETLNDLLKESGLDSGTDSSNVGVDVGSSNRVQIVRDYFPAVKRADGNLDVILGNRVEDTIKQKLGLTGQGSLSPEQLAKFESDIGIKPGTLRYSQDGALAADAWTDEKAQIIEGQHYVSEEHNSSTPGSINGRRALYALYQSLNFDILNG